jgi:hypothetical protein
VDVSRKLRDGARCRGADDDELHERALDDLRTGLAAELLETDERAGSRERDRARNPGPPDSS